MFFLCRNCSVVVLLPCMICDFIAIGVFVINSVASLFIIILTVRNFASLFWGFQLFFFYF